MAPVTKPLMSPDVMAAKIRILEQKVHDIEEYVDTVSSPLYKRVLWWFQGYYFRKVGRWY